MQYLLQFKTVQTIQMYVVGENFSIITPNYIPTHISTYIYNNLKTCIILEIDPKKKLQLTNHINTK